MFSVVCLIDLVRLVGSVFTCPVVGFALTRVPGGWWRGAMIRAGR